MSHAVHVARIYYFVALADSLPRPFSSFQGHACHLFPIEEKEIIRAMTRRLLRKLCVGLPLLAAFTLTSINPAEASCYNPAKGNTGTDVDTPEEALATNKVVFRGKVVAVSKDGPSQDVGRTAMFDVLEVRKGGPLPTLVEVSGIVEPGTPGVSTRDRLFTLGSTYLVFPRNEGSPFGDDACSATRPDGSSVGQERTVVGSLRSAWTSGEAGHLKPAALSSATSLPWIPASGVLVLAGGLAVLAIRARRRTMWVPQKPLAIVLVLGVGALLLDAGLRSDSARAVHQYDSTHWSRSVGESAIPLTLKNQIGANASPYINATLAHWGSQQAGNWWPSGPARTDFSFGYVYDGPPACDQFNTRVTIFCGSDHSDAHITFNHLPGTYMHIKVSDQGTQGVYCQEFGHSLGLNHPSSGSTCMRLANTYATPNQHDLDLSRDISLHTH